WEVSIPDLPGSVRAIQDDRIIGTTMATGTAAEEITIWGISIKPGDEGRLLFNKTVNAPAIWADGDIVTPLEATTHNGENGVIVYGARELTKFYGFSTETGDLLWETPAQIEEDPDAYLNWYGWTAFAERPTIVAYDKLIATGIGGIVYGYDILTGELAWKYKAVDPYSEFLFNNNWWLFPQLVADGVVYFGSLEHSPIDPRPRGAPYIALNVTTGEEVFRVNGLIRQSLWGGQSKMGDSVILTQDTYSQRVYGIGKGPSALTVAASPKVSVQGTSVLVEGMVTDVSPGTNDLALTMRFANGVPAVADESMSEWMLYVYKQFERPSDTVGVDVIITVLDPNNNIYDVGTATSDSSGMFSLLFEPEVPGKYTVIATFPGSEGYFGSFSETAIGVDEAPPLPPPPADPISLPPTETYITAATIAIIIAIAIVGLLLFRKR
ncbi:MAG: hypothetical protein ACYTEO_19030, partial [Planctomycetota bacterium]